MAMAMKLRVQVDVELDENWTDPELSVSETLDFLVEEYPSVGGLLIDCMDGSASTAVVVLSQGGVAAVRDWRTD